MLVTVDGRSEADAGLSLLELADVLVELGPHAAVNLDGASAAPVWDGRRRNMPRADDRSDLPRASPPPPR
jgi:exopolysaccharide biosynthesis protein